MQPVVMTAIEYNTWMSVIDFISVQLPLVAARYGLSGISVDVIPAYPRDLTKFHKPAMIIQKIHTRNSSVGFGNFLGQYTDTDSDIAYDTTGSIYDMVYQIDINSDMNSECSLLTDAVYGIIGGTFGIDNAIVLKDYTDISRPAIGSITIGHDIDTTSLASNDNDDYGSAIRIDLSVIQSVVDIDQPMVDLSKPIRYNKYSQTIKL